MMMRGGEPAKTPSPKRALSTTEIMVTKLRSRSHNLAEDLGKICHPGLVKSGVESVKDQIKYLKDALDKNASQGTPRSVVLFYLIVEFTNGLFLIYCFSHVF